MNDDIRVSDADRERVAEQLREHYAAGRLSTDELDERITATLGARTFRDLHAVMTDLPGEHQLAAQPPPQNWPRPHGQGWHGRAVVPHRHGPRFLPLLVLAVIAAIAIPGAGVVLVTFLKFALVFWLVACVAAAFAAHRFRRRIRRMAQQQSLSGGWQQFEWHHH
jgi:hypothetical protein